MSRIPELSWFGTRTSVLPPVGQTGGQHTLTEALLHTRCKDSLWPQGAQALQSDRVEAGRPTGTMGTGEGREERGAYGVVVKAVGAGCQFSATIYCPQCLGQRLNLSGTKFLTCKMGTQWKPP